MTEGQVCMLDINNLQLSDLNQTLTPVRDTHLSDLKKAWYYDSQQSVDHGEFVDKASAWFQRRHCARFNR